MGLGGAVMGWALGFFVFLFLYQMARRMERNEEELEDLRSRVDGDDDDLTPLP